MMTLLTIFTLVLNGSDLRDVMVPEAFLYSKFMPLEMRHQSAINQLSMYLRADRENKHIPSCLGEMMSDAHSDRFQSIHQLGVEALPLPVLPGCTPPVNNGMGHAREVYGLCAGIHWVLVFNPADSRKSGESCALRGLSAWSLSRDLRGGQHGGMIVQVTRKLILPNWLTSRPVRGWLAQVVSYIKCRLSGVKGH